MKHFLAAIILFTLGMWLALACFTGHFYLPHITWIETRIAIEFVLMILVTIAALSILSL